MHEVALDEPEREYRMRVRVSLRALWAMLDMRGLLNPLFFGKFSLQLLSHKLLRYTAFIPLSLALISNLLLLGAGRIYWLSILAQVLVYGAAWAVYQQPEIKNRWAKMCFYFVQINWASAHACYLFALGKKIALWKPREG